MAVAVQGLHRILVAHSRAEPGAATSAQWFAGAVDAGARQPAVLELLARLDRDRGRALDPGERAALEQWAGRGPMAKAFHPYEHVPAWQQVGARLRDLLSPEEGSAAQQATTTSFYTSPVVTAAIGFDGSRCSAVSVLG
jgi:hypothetical protein